MTRVHWARAGLFWAGAALLGMATWGCGAPTFQPVAPPGLTYTPTVPEDKDDVAEAIGEARAAMDRPQQAPVLPPPPPTAAPTKVGEAKKQPSGIEYVTLAEGKGATAEWGKTLKVHYTGTLTNGRTFDSSRGREPLEVKLGYGKVIPGFEQGLLGMKVGEKRRLTIPPDLAYGSQVKKGIPANSTLVFEIELMGVQ